MVAEGGRLTHELLLCTRNRSAFVRECLAHVLASTDLPDRIVVVDSSDDKATEQVCREVAASPGCPPLEYHRHAPGLTAQRNAALRLAHADIVHFIDDDSMVEPDYFEQILAAFTLQGSRVVGVGGILKEDHWLTKSRRRTREFFGLAGAPGTVTRAAANIPIDPSITTSGPAAWLMGGSMSFRTGPARDTMFDESLMGYALGEDLDFTLRIRRLGDLWTTRDAVIDHRTAPGGRPDAQLRARQEVLLRDLLLRRNPDLFSRTAFWWSVVGLLVILPAGGLLRWSAEPLRQWVGTVQGAWAVLRGRRRPLEPVFTR